MFAGVAQFSQCVLPVEGWGHYAVRPVTPFHTTLGHMVFIFAFSWQALQRVLIRGLLILLRRAIQPSTQVRVIGLAVAYGSCDVGAAAMLQSRGCTVVVPSQWRLDFREVLLYVFQSNVVGPSYLKACFPGLCSEGCLPSDANLFNFHTITTSRAGEMFYLPDSAQPFRFTCRPSLLIWPKLFQKMQVCLQLKLPLSFWVCLLPWSCHPTALACRLTKPQKIK